MQKLHITILFQFAFFQGIVDMTGNNRLVLLKKLCHLSLCQPHCLILQTYINLCLSVFCLIYYNFVFFHNFTSCKDTKFF